MMTTLLKTFKPFDYIFIGLAILLSFLPLAWTSYQQLQQGKDTGLVAVVTIRGEIVDEFPLRLGDQPFEKTYHPNPGQYNIIEVSDGRIRVKEDNSPDQIAVRTGWIDKAGQLSVCLPHQLMIEIRATDPTIPSEDEVILPL